MARAKPRARGLWARIVRPLRRNSPIDPAQHPLRGPLASLAPNLGKLVERCRTNVGAVYLGDHTSLCRCLGLFKLYVDTRDKGFAVNLLLDGGWELWATVFIARQVRPGMTVVDVGANYGYYTLLLAWLVGDGGRVIAVEPNPAAAAKLRDSIELNGVVSRTRVVSAAAGAVDGGEALLFVPDGEPKNASIVGSPEAVGSRAGILHAVPQVTLDRIADDLTRINFVKIDAEGAEEAIISGMRRTLARDKPGLVLEFNALRCADADSLLSGLSAIYGQLHYIDDLGEPVATTAKHLLAERQGLDWLLCLGFGMGA
jgi:FkbM family methyltransferase